jgi:hypothetical protein
MAQKFTLSARSPLMANISAVDTSLLVDVARADLFPVADTGTDPVPTVGKDWFKIILEDTSSNKEVVYVRTRTLGAAAMTNVLRGREGTTARAFLAGGTIVGLRHTAADLEDAISFASGASAFWKSLVGWTTQALSRAALGASAVGDAIFTAANAGAARSTLGATAIGEALFTATDQTTALAILTSDFKGSLRVATTANIASLAGGAPNVLDGVSLAANDRVLVKDQSTGSQNGLYFVATLGTGVNGTWTRTTDADASGELTSGAVFAVEEGTTNADSLWMLTTDGTITIGTTALIFAKKDASAVRQIQSLPDPTLAANAMTLPASTHSLDFRSATLSTGVIPPTVSGTAAALVIPAGATLGTVNAVQSTIVEVILNNGGTLEKAVVNIAGGNDLSETGVINTTAISAGATSANVFYSTTARTGVAYRVVRTITSTQATAGTWATAPSTIQGQGGQALAAMSSGGFGQTPRTVTRDIGTTYYGAAKPIGFSYYQYVNNTAESGAALTVNGVQVASCIGAAAGIGMAQNTSMYYEIPPFATYSLSGNAGNVTERR